MTQKSTQSIQPEYADRNSLELELVDTTSGAIRYLEHGYPNPLVRWHYHDEYELHYIVVSSGKVFVGDYIGEFQPGNLILTGPRLPHNWISDLDGVESYALRDMVIQFRRDNLENAAAYLPEFRDLLPLLDAAQFGLEFPGMQSSAEHYMRQVRDSTGTMRLGWFCQFLHELARCGHCKVLSTSRIETKIDQAGQEKINTVVGFVMDRYRGPITLGQVAELVNMNQSYFSRYFRKATGNTFNDFLTGIRISKACDLLALSDRQITSICYEVGYNNVANFNRRFLERMRMTPRDYRRQVQHRLIRGDTSSMG